MGNERSIEVSIDIAASAEEVWRALTEAAELTRWFPLSAEVTPGEGGSMRWTWDDAWTWVSTIERWEPGRVLRLANREQRPFDTEGQPLPSGQVAPANLAMEFTLATDSGITRLRLIHSGFGRGAAWDDELDGVSVGWRAELTSLKHYLEQHRGRNRRGGLARTSTLLSQEQAWSRLLGPGGFVVKPWPVSTGSTCEVGAPADRFHGIVMVHLPERDLSVAVDELGGGVWRLGTHRADGRTGVSVWVASYTADQAFVDGLKTRVQQRLDALFQT